MSGFLKFFKKLFVSEGKLKLSQKTSPEDELTLRLKPYERYLYQLQDIIVWKDTSTSIFAVVLVNVFFWFVSFFEWKFFGFFFTVLSGVLIHDAWSNYIWPEIRVKTKEERLAEEEPPPPGLIPLSELSRYATELQSSIVLRYKKLRYLRATQPAVFCVVSSLCCLLVAGVGTVLSGACLLYLGTVGLFTLPGAYIHLVTPEQKDLILKTLSALYCILLPPESSNNVDEYIPDTSKENLDILSKAGNNSNDLSTPSSDSSMVDLIPCHDESSQDTLDSFSLPAVPEQAAANTDSDPDDLSFKNSMSNSSSSEEASLVRNLSFAQIDAAAGTSGGGGPFNNSLMDTGGLRSALTGVFYKTFPAMSGRLQFKAAGEEIVPTPTAEDSDSEFEIIDEDS